MTSHDELIQRASTWLANSMRCSVVITEMAGGWEEPDAIGWNNSNSILVECKTSKSDFANDRWKSGRLSPASLGMGNKRFYLVPPDLLEYAKANLIDRWGLLVAYKRRVESKVESDWFPEARKEGELSLMISALRRIAGEKSPIAGMNVRYYTILNPDAKHRATLGISNIEE